MFPRFLSLLGLGFCLGQRIWTLSGGHDKPSLSAWPSPVVPLGGRVTLQCHYHHPFSSFKLTKIKGTPSPDPQRDHINTFTMSPVTIEHAGSYRCFGRHSHTSGWSAFSDTLDIVVTGVFKKPSLSAQPSSLVHAGEAVTLHCHSELVFDQFILCKKDTHHSWQVVEKLFVKNRQAYFSMGPMTPAHAGTYRCYGSSHSSYEWSAPSDLLEVVITESSTSTCFSPTESRTRKEASAPQENSSKLYILIGLSVACLLIGVSLAALLYYWCFIKNRAALREPEPKEDQMMNGEDLAAEDTHSVIYAQLALQQRGLTPSSLSTKDVSTEPSVYMEFRVNQAHAEARPGPGL